MNKVELTGNAYDIVVVEEGCCLFDLEFETDKFVTVGCIGTLAIMVSKKLIDGMKISVNGKISIDTEEEFFPYLGDREIFLKADDVTFMEIFIKAEDRACDITDVHQNGHFLCRWE